MSHAKLYGKLLRNITREIEDLEERSDSELKTLAEKLKNLLLPTT
jgi:hypothetical protein